jgi:hypothetical protein
VCQGPAELRIGQAFGMNVVMTACGSDMLHVEILLLHADCLLARVCQVHVELHISEMPYS